MKKVSVPQAPRAPPRWIHLHLVAAVRGVRPSAIAMMLDANAFGMAERLRNHNGYLDSLISMVPAKYYFPPDPEEMAKKFQKHVNKPATQTAADKLQRKMESSERKRAKLDPEQLTVPQQQQHNAEQEEQERVRDRSQQRRRSQQGGESEGEDEDEAPGPVSAALSGYNTGDVSTVSELKARLQAKLEKLRNGRGGAPKSSLTLTLTPTLTPTPALTLTLTLTLTLIRCAQEQRGARERARGGEGGEEEEKAQRQGD